MARKKSKQPSPKEFTNSPFKSLKGLSASDRKTDDDKPSRETVDLAAPGDPERETSFADEMDFLGVEPLPGQTVEEGEGDEVFAGASSGTSEVSDEELFLEALGSMGKTFKDDWTEEGDSRQAAPRRMKQVERGQLVPEDELDLHGLTVGEATEKVRFFLQNAFYHGHGCVLLITGKGLHSDEGPVLRQAVERLLSTLRDQVVEFGVAPRRFGGEGALVVFLRRR